MACPTHTIVDKVCYWGPRPIRKWKRPFLLLGSIILAILASAFIFLVCERQPYISLLVLGFGILSGAVFGIIVGLVGCDDCVAKLSGDFL